MKKPATRQSDPDESNPQWSFWNAPAIDQHRPPSVPDLLLAGILVLASMLWLYSTSGDIEYLSDSAVYLDGANSIATGQGYRFMSMEGTPLIGFYPPLNSSYLSIFWRLNPVFPGNIPTLNAGMFIISSLCVGLFYLLMRSYGLPTLHGLLIAVGFATSTLWAYLAVTLYSEAIFFALLLGTLLLWEVRLQDKPGLRWALTGLGLGLAYLARSAAAPFAVAALIAVAVANAKKRPILVVSYLVPLGILAGLWKLASLGTMNYGAATLQFFEHLGGWKGYLALLWDKIAILGWQQTALAPISTFLPSFPAVGAKWLNLNPTLAYAIIAGGQIVFLSLAARGWWRLRSGHATTLLVGVLIYMAQVILVPWEHYSRFMFPIILPLFAWAWHGLPRGRTDGQCGRLAYYASAMVLLGLVATNIALTPRQARGWSEASRRHLNELSEAAEWINRNVPPEQRVAATYKCSLPHLAAWTGRRFVVDYLYPYELWLPLSHEAQGSPQASYVLVTGPGDKANAPAGLFTKVFSTKLGSYQLLKIDPELEGKVRKLVHEPVLTQPPLNLKR